MYYPRSAKFSKLTVVWGHYLTRGNKQVTKNDSLEAEALGLGLKSDYFAHAETVDK